MAKTMATNFLILFLSLFQISNGFLVGPSSRATSAGTTRLASTNTDKFFELEIDLPPSNSDKKALMRIEPVLSVPSEIIEVRYRVPFGLDVAPLKGLAVCTKDGPGGEKVNDILRYTSFWQLGLPQGEGLMETAAAFGGGLSWQCSLFDVMKAEAWPQVVEALTSNVDSRTDEVVLLFERSLSGTAPELEKGNSA